MNTLEKISFRTSLILIGVVSLVSRALAQDFGGPIPEIPGTPGGDVDEDSFRQIVLDIITFVLNFLALLAIIFIIVAGIRLIVSQGEDEQKDKAKKTILYVIIGLLVILFARVIVGFFTLTVGDIAG